MGTGWRRIAGYSGGGAGGAVRLVEYGLPAPSPALTGESLVFLSDLHFDESTPAAELVALVNDLNPKWLLFGGDLISYSCHFRAAMEFMSELKAETAKIAVSGNWDKKRRRWFPNHLWRNAYERAGFELLVNRSISRGGIAFHGLDDFKQGRPWLPEMSRSGPNVILSHGPDGLIAALEKAGYPNFDLALCGHTHGGQIRVPWFGALKTSSVHWKKFEYGHYRRNDGGIGDMVVSCGIGYTGLPVRLFCRPEVALINFTLNS